VKVLHIEDNDSVLALIKSICGKSIDIESVSCLAEAKTKINTCQIDLLLVNINLIDSIGINTIKQLVEYNIPIIILTKNVDKKLSYQANELGVDRCIEKLNVSNINLIDIFTKTIQNHNLALKMKNYKFSFGDIENLKPYITCHSTLNIV
jgi:DNA-binding NarL/FixJ family response regulator